MSRTPRYDPAKVREARKLARLAKANAARARYRALRQEVADAKLADRRAELIAKGFLLPSLVGTGAALIADRSKPAPKHWPKWLKDRPAK